MTRVVTGAQYASGRRASPATATETTAATAVRKEWTTTGQSSLPERRYAGRLLFPLGMQLPFSYLLRCLDGASAGRKRVVNESGDS